MQGRPMDDPRYPRPSATAAGPTGQSHHRSNSFLRELTLPPPSPRGYLPQSPGFRDAPSPSGGHTDPSSWVQHPERPPSSRGMATWSPSVSGLSPRTGDVGGGGTSSLGIGAGGGGGGGGGGGQGTGGQRLPPLADFPHRSATAWDGHGSYPIVNHRGASSSGYQYRSASPRVPLMTPVTHSGSGSGSVSVSVSMPGPGPGVPSREGREGREGSGRDARGSSSQSPAGTPSSHFPSQHGTVKDEKTDSDPSAPKKKKRRVALSCAECAKRKQKCNRETPCQHCVSRRVPELCVPYSRHGTPPSRPSQSQTASATTTAAAGDKAKSSPGIGGAAEAQAGSEPQSTARPPSMLPTLSVRVGRLEAMVNAMANRVDGLEGKALSDWRINHAPASSPAPLRMDPGSPSDEPPNSASTAWHLPMHIRRDRQDNDHDHDPREGTHELADRAGEDVVFGLDRDTSIRNPLPQSMIRSTGPVPRGLDYHGTPAEQLQRLFEDCGVSPHKVQDLIQDLPAKSFADDLVAWYFSKIDYVRYPIDEHLFRQAFEDVYSSQAIDSNHVIALPLVFIVLALAVRVAPGAWEYSEEQKRTSSLRFYWNSKNAILIASAVKAESLQLVETRLLTGLYLVLMHERRLAEGWAEFRSAITTGQAIGLHRDGKKLGLDPYLTEYRRRLWSYLVHADATYSCLLGRPTSISPDCSDTLPPQNINLSTLRTDPRAQPRPMAEPTFATYLILRRRLGEIVAKVTQHFQRLNGQTQYRDVEALDAQFKALVNELPECFAMKNPDKSYDEKLWYLPVHRYYIQTEILHFIIIFHRPWLLRKLRSSRYALSRAACFDAAVTDFKIRRQFKKDCPDFFETLLGSSFREFNAAMIAGISLIMDPNAAHAKDMRAIVESFMEHFPHDPKADDFSQKEALIIHTLHRRALEMAEHRDNGRPRTALIRGTHDKVSAERENPQPAPYAGPGQVTPLSRSPISQSPAVNSSTNANLNQIQSQGQAGMGVTKSPYGVLPTPPGVSSSPEEDQPQRLLDHWLMSNTSFGPGSDPTINPYTGIYGFPPTGAYGNTYNVMAPTGMAMPPMGDPNVNGSAAGWMNLAQTTQTQAPMGMGPMGMIGGDGNSVVYWDTLIDGIMGGVGMGGSGYDGGAI